MGFLKRIFSIGSKKQKKRQQVPDDLPPPLPSIDEERRRKLEEEEHEAAVGRLLRSSSSRFAVVKEVDYSNLPPLPHPINDVLAQCAPQQREKTPSLRPSASTLSLASSTFSHHSTYSVTVHDRQRHAATEFPNANGELLKTPTNHRQRNESNRANGHQLGLRSDPSVASLIELYDDHGRLPPETFSNSPPQEKHGRQQKKRNGSTLRELLGAPDSIGSKANSAAESDISWAERFLGEVESASSHTSSYGPHTPTDTANDRTAISRPHDITFSTDLSTSFIDDPAITSLEVELSDTSIPDPAAKGNNPYKNIGPNTPQRASQVFSFLTKRNTIHDGRSLQDLPSAFSSSSEISHENLRSRFSTDGSQYGASPTPRKGRNSYGPFQETMETPMPPPRVPDDGPPEPTQHQVHVLMTGPTKVIVTAPTPGAGPTPSRIPIRGPRQPPKRRSSSSRRPPMLTHRMNSSVPSRISSKDSLTSIPQRKPHRRATSHGSTISAASSTAEADAMATVRVLDNLTRNKTYHNSPSRGDKENQLGLTARVELPSTPLRKGSSLFRKVVTPSMFQPPVYSESRSASPAELSSELSPVGKQMMLDARKQRMRTREAENRSGRRAVIGSRI
ncbi:hypothetical protein P691DRAFT_692828 [Macrolepiota fuliginosa MF-IS2]|uniref:Uncharacterized protein n=1 Tax=Macrolepiota fuliginosa MF-IS2 TaxID=1400762 RepID=A0A9P5XPN7_9AGAR|nr:hypothetical protein P691DRAFT_692828 [Macrolepiota fuliginosa MF-IS2]